jgi:hypothetical protein
MRWLALQIIERLPNDFVQPEVTNRLVRVNRMFSLTKASIIGPSQQAINLSTSTKSKMEVREKKKREESQRLICSQATTEKTKQCSRKSALALRSRWSYYLHHRCSLWSLLLCVFTTVFLLIYSLLNSAGPTSTEPLNRHMTV